MSCKSNECYLNGYVRFFQLVRLLHSRLNITALLILASLDPTHRSGIKYDPSFIFSLERVACRHLSFAQPLITFLMSLIFSQRCNPFMCFSFMRIIFLHPQDSTGTFNSSLKCIDWSKAQWTRGEIHVLLFTNTFDECNISLKCA